MPNEQYKRLFAAIQAGARGQTKDDIIGAVVDGLANSLASDTISGKGTSLESAQNFFNPGGLALGAIYAAYKLIRSRKEVAESPNPYFVFNGQCDESDPASPVTLNYVRTRLLKGVAATAIQVGGSASAKLMADVDVVSALQHGNATGSTIAHIMKLKAIAKSYKQSETISGWINVILTLKMQKATIRGGQAIGSLIPGAGLPIAIATTVAKIGIKLTLSKVIYWTAAELHWRAFAERAINRNAVGPASRIIGELFTRRGATRIFGKYDVDAIIKEPCGWMAVADKIGLI